METFLFLRFSLIHATGLNSVR